MHSICRKTTMTQHSHTPTVQFKRNSQKRIAHKQKRIICQQGKIVHKLKRNM